MRIVVFISESLPSNVIMETLLHEVPGRVVGIVVSRAFERGVSAPRSLLRLARRMGLRFFATAARFVIEVNALWSLGRMRGSRTLPPALRELAAASAIPLIPTRNVNGADTLSALRALAPDLIVSIYFNQRIGRAALVIPRLGAINLHPALLPKHRGPSPHFWVVAAGEERTGVTVHWIDERLDTGDILLQREVAVPAGASISTLIGTVVRPGAATLVEAVRLIEAGKRPRHPQDSLAAVYESWPTQRDFIRLRRRGGRYGNGSELIAHVAPRLMRMVSGSGAAKAIGWKNFYYWDLRGDRFPAESAVKWGDDAGAGPLATGVAAPAMRCAETSVGRISYAPPELWSAIEPISASGSIGFTEGDKALSTVTVVIS